MRLKPFFCFYGGKWRMAPRYPPPCHDTIVEPFAGAAGYATRYSARNVVLVERDPTVAALWKFLIGVSSSEIRALPILQPGETTDDVAACEEARSLIGFWLNKGSAAPRKKQSAWMRGGTRPNSYWGETIRARIASQVDDIRHWQIIEGDYSAAPTIEATWFIDPPYSNAAGRHYNYSVLDYSSLATWCRTRTGQVMTCENVGASWLPFEPFIVSKTSAAYGKPDSSEALWTNRL